MLDKRVEQLKEEIGMEKSSLETFETEETLFFAENIKVLLTKMDSYLFLKSTIFLLPQGKNDTFLIRAMEANLFGKGTRGLTIGISQDEKFLTLVADISANASYKEFKEKMEDFVTMVDFWRKEADDYFKQID